MYGEIFSLYNIIITIYKKVIISHNNCYTRISIYRRDSVRLGHVHALHDRLFFIITAVDIILPHTNRHIHILLLIIKIQKYIILITVCLRTLFGLIFYCVRWVSFSS